ncbi:hypothetical protein FNV43_RR09649 [Rhamnella rubrinervis]|uniref:YbhB/YbcL family Raf kinase inhibitor-like protein n=1 Tax=Rhamnella rubrinervis TaxID=2594499 RepID=A0A8K0HAU4_9ROSA|nr:hypothetical protein FNV43_RR09649 [Rhamnella rubrinervis]
MASDEFRLVAPSIDKAGRLPRQYTGEGQGAKKNISPPLEWYNLPEGTKTLALVVQDLDASDPDGPIVPWTHWVVVNIPASVPGWRGPVLPHHGHRFEFKLYALDDELHLGNKVTKEKLLDAIEGHVLGEAVLMAVF